VDQLETPSMLSRALVVHARTLKLFDDFGIVERAVALGRRTEAVNVVGASGLHAPVPMQVFSWLETVAAR
jgi:2-polyprenyl-6-methoxyphenol hydroxylase-like FAD-dependent oxidoreductase